MLLIIAISPLVVACLSGKRSSSCCCFDLEIDESHVEEQSGGDRHASQ